MRFGPTLEFNGIGGGYQGKGSKTVIPSEAFAKITCRLVANQDPKKIMDAVSGAIEARCPDALEINIRRGHGGEPYMVIPAGRPNAPADQPDSLIRAFTSAEASIEKAFGKPPIFLREGGSIPVIAAFKNRAGLGSLMIGLFTPLDNLHAPDESFDLSIMNNAIAAFEQIIISIAGVE